jgi:hypothetical protein
MGMTIDKTIEFFNGLECHTPQAKDARDIAVDTMRKYQMMEADYKARLKADMVAMLTEIQLEIEELDTPSNSDAYMTCSELIQQKIDKLKE